MNQYIQAESVQLVSSGNDYFDMLSDIISSAKEVIHIQTYIVEEDKTGKEIKGKLKLAAGRGVKIFFLADAFGSKDLSKEFILEMKSAGIQFRFFSPLFSSEAIYLGRRLHHKIVVADKKIALVGGINIANKYHGSEGNPPWLDFAVLIKGCCCEPLHNLCEGIFNRKRIVEQNTKIDVEKTGPMVRFRRNDWVRRKNEIHKSYKEAILNADEKIIFLASYFLPGPMFQKLLKQTVARGIKIKIIVSGKTDVPFIHLAEKYLYSKLLKIGVEVYEWSNSVMHGKVMSVDDGWVTIGSYNVNYLSHYRSIEMNVDIQDSEFSQQVSRRLEEIIKEHCQKITSELIQKESGWMHELNRKFVYHFIRIMMNIFLPKKKITIN